MRGELSANEGPRTFRLEVISPLTAYFRSANTHRAKLYIINRDRQKPSALFAEVSSHV